MSEFEIDTSTSIRHFTDHLVDLLSINENTECPTSSSNKFSVDSSLEFTQPSSATNVPQ